MPAAGASTDPDRSFLEDAFDAAVERLARGDEVAPGELCAGRPELLSRVEGLVALAQSVLVRPSGALPQVPGFQVLGELGRGGMGVVWIARQDRVGGRIVALKTLTVQAPLPARERQRFLREAHALGRLSHPNVVAVHDVVAEPGYLAYAMEWVEGISLAQLIAALGGTSRDATLERLREALGAPEDALLDRTVTRYLCRVCHDVARALHAVHEARLVHRDVKPSNVLLRRDGTPLLSDFGLVREEGGPLRTRTGAFLGTPAYAAPEQLRGELERVDRRSDVFSLGATLYHALSGGLPFAGTTTAEILEGQQRGARPLHRRVSGLARDLSTIVAKALELEPERRYADAAALAEDLERLLDLRPILAKPEPVARRALRLARRNRRTLTGAVAGSVLAGLAVALVLLRIFWVPGEVQASVRHARLLLLNPAHWEATVAGSRPEYFGVEPTIGPRADPETPARYRRALAFYDHARRLGGLDDSLRRERTAVETAAAVIEGSPLPAASAGAPALGRYVSARAAGEDMAELVSDVIEGGDAPTLRSLGLLAYLVGDALACNDLWTALRYVPGQDELVDAALGLVRLGLQRPEQAVLSLAIARDRFPDAGFLQARLADALLQVGDAEGAAALMEDFRRRGLEAAYDHDRLVEADLAAWNGDLERALMLHLGHTAFHRSAQNYLHAADLAQRLGKHELAARLLGYMTTLMETGFAAEGEWIRSELERWWSSLAPSEKTDLVAKTLDDQHKHRWPPLLPAYRHPGAEELGHPGSGEGPGTWRIPRLFLERWDSFAARQPLPPRGGGPTLDELWVTRALFKPDLATMRRLGGEWKVVLAAASLFLDALPGVVRREVGGGADILPACLRRVAVAFVERRLESLARELASTPQAPPGTLAVLVGDRPGDRFGDSLAGAGDLDGDGYDDFVVGAPTRGGRGYVRAFSGRTLAVLWTFDGLAEGDGLGCSLASVTDVDGDGVRELAVGAQQGYAQPGYTLVLSGADPARGPVLRVVGEDPGDQFGASVAGLEDLDGDGQPELLVGATQHKSSRGYAAVHSTSTGKRLRRHSGGPVSRLFGYAACTGADFDADGVGDYVVTAPYHDQSAGRVHVYSGASGEELASLGGHASSFLGGALAVVPSIDGDMTPDLVVGAYGYRWNPGAVLAYSGANLGPGSRPAPLWRVEGDRRGSLGTAIAAWVDADGDGVPDVLAGEAGFYVGEPGQLELISGAGGERVVSLRGELSGNSFALALCTLGDVDGDGLPELVVGSPGSAAHSVDKAHVITGSVLVGRAR